MSEKNVKTVAPITLKNMSIPYNTDRWHPRNFSGIYIPELNSEGERNFCIFLPPDQVDIEQLIEDGWNIKPSTNKKDPQAEPTYLLRVKVRYHPENSDLARLNPRIRVVTSKGFMMMDQTNVGDLDRAQIIKANMTIRGRWNESKKYTGVTAYLASMVVRVFEEEPNMDDLMEGIMDD